MNMKKLISIILATLMIVSMTTAFAADVTYPENLAQGCYAVSSSKVDLGTTTKVDTEGAMVTAINGGTSPFGDASAILDGKGMIGTYIVGTDGVATSTLIAEGVAAGTAVPNNADRWGAEKGTTPTITIDFGKDVTFSSIKFTEARRIVGKYKITWYNDGVACSTPFVGEFTQTAASGQDNYVYLKEIELGQIVNADKVEFQIVSLLRDGAYVLSITEMEFWSNPVIATTEGAQNSTSGGVYKIFDGENMITTDKSTDTPPANSERLIFDKGITDFTIMASFAKDITVNTIKFTEYKTRINGYEIHLYKDGIEVGNHIGSLNNVSETAMYLRTIALEQSYNIDTITFKATSFHKEDTVHILEMEFYDGVTAPTVTTTGTLDIIKGDATVLFDGVYDSDESISDGILQIRAHNASTNENLLDDLTITFDLGAEKTFNYAELAERRCVLGAIDVQYKDASGEWVSAGTIPAQAYVNSTHEFIRSVSFEPVTARYVRLVVNSIAKYADIPNASSMRTININEITLCNYDSSEAGEATIYPIRAFGENINSLSGISGRINANVMLKNETGSTKAYKIIAAQYSAGGVLEAVALNDTSVPANTSTIVNTALKVNDDAESIEQNTVRYFVWDGLTLAPYCPAVGIPNQN